MDFRCATMPLVLLHTCSACVIAVLRIFAVHYRYEILSSRVKEFIIIQSLIESLGINRQT